jgi:Protein of unknown function (DUF551)
MSEWISVKDRLPEESQDALAFDDCGVIHMAIYSPEGLVYRWHCDTYGLYPHEVTHWMPLPEPPKEQP